MIEIQKPSRIFESCGFPATLLNCTYNAAYQIGIVGSGKFWIVFCFPLEMQDHWMLR